MKPKYFAFIIPVWLAACERSDETGQILKFYGDAREDIGYSITAAGDGYFIGGQLTQVKRSPETGITGSSKKIGIIKTGLDGNVIWQNYFGGKFQGSGSKIIALDDGSAVCAGQVTDTMTSKTDIFVVKVGSDGSTLSQKIFAMPGNQTSTDILKTTGGYFLLGTTDEQRAPVTDSSGNKAGKKDILLMKLLENLDQDPSVTISPKGFPNDDYGAAIKKDLNGDYIIAGTTSFSTGDKPGQAGNNLWIIKVDSLGREIESAILGGAQDEVAADMEIVSNGYLLAGTIGSGTGQSVYVMKVRSDTIDRAPVFTRTLGTGSWSVKAISRYRTSSFVLAGQAGTKMLLFVVDQDGNIMPDKQLVTGSYGSQAANDVIYDTEGYVVAVGRSLYETNSMICFLKLKF